MKCHLRVATVSLWFVGSCFCTHAQTAPIQTTPKLSATVSDVKGINTSKLLQVMNAGSPDFIAVSAHRAYWVTAPENSAAAIKAAFNAGVEVVEIDLRASSDGVLVVSHDSDLIKETTAPSSGPPNGGPFVNSLPWSQISQYQLRDRKGNPWTDPGGGSNKLLQFSDVLNILNEFSTGAGQGPVIIADIKDRDQAWTDYLTAVNVLSAYPGIQKAVVFKMALNRLPTDDDGNQQLVTAYNNFKNSGYGSLVLTVNPENATGGTPDWSPGSSNFKQLYQYYQSGFVAQFEMNIVAPGDGSTEYLNGLAGPLTAIATYYESKFYPEGVSTIYGGSGDKRIFNPPLQNPPPPGTTFCCYLPNLAAQPTAANANTQDLRGVLSFSLLYNNNPSVPNSSVSLITTDDLFSTLSYLNSVGKRNLSEIQ